MNPYPDFPRGRGFGGGFLIESHHGGAHPLEWAIFAILLAVLLLTAATLATALARRGRGGGGPRWRPAVAGGGPPLPPEAVLGARYARGEVGRDEFLRALDDLRGATPRPTIPADEAPTAERPPE